MPPRKKGRKETADITASGGATNTGAAPAEAPTPVLALAPARRNLRGRRGGLRDMPNMPLDILIEVTSPALRNASELHAHNRSPFYRAVDIRSDAPTRPAQPGTHVQELSRVPDEPWLRAVLEGRAHAGRGPAGLSAFPERTAIRQSFVLPALSCEWHACDTHARRRVLTETRFA